MNLKLCCADCTILFVQGFFRKGNVLLEMGQQTEALIQFHHCLKVQTDFVSAKTQIKKVCSPLLTMCVLIFKTGGVAFM